jgi:hypothetical protein
MLSEVRREREANLAAHRALALGRQTAKAVVHFLRNLSRDDRDFPALHLGLPCLGLLAIRKSVRAACALSRTLWSRGHRLAEQNRADEQLKKK